MNLPRPVALGADTTSKRTLCKVVPSVLLLVLNDPAYYVSHRHCQSPMKPESEIRLIAFATAAEWEQWLAANHTLYEGVWIKFAKKASGVASVTYAEALDVALCHGWIDGQLKSIDAIFYRQRFTPRRPRSVWSKRNIEKVAVLIAAGRMKPAGQEQIDAAKKDGRWARAYDSPSTMQMPADFQAALDANPKARAFFASLNRSNVYAFLYRLQTLKRPETRAARIKEYIQLLKAGKALHLFAPKKKPAAELLSNAVKSRRSETTKET